MKLQYRYKEKQINLNDCDDSETQNFKKDVQVLNNTFKNDIIKEFSSVYVETEKYINYSDYDKYLKKINDMEYKKHVLRVDEEMFYANYYHDIEESRINKITHDTLHDDKNIKQNNCCGL